jgi:hypothetical protein
LEQPRTALTTNFLRVELDREMPANRLVDVVLGDNLKASVAQ